VMKEYRRAEEAEKDKRDKLRKAADTVLPE
jgi:hypothetical protein